ncbi:MAG TPA: monovalent cation/H+ antiporter subunit D [Polyangiaceae bacterium]|nr:monovalent cation/H+ antiporter subunit D [Polyangiaceae bacterium]
MKPELAHLIVVPIVLPLLVTALLLLLGARRRRLGSLIHVGAALANLLVALEILRRIHADGLPGAVKVYLAGNWPAHFGIVLVADRLSALMLVLTGVVGLAAAVYSSAAWGRVSVFFFPLFQIQLMGLNGAFLTGDLFNLFVFFEVLLAASYGLQLHGSGRSRVRAGLHYIAVNLLASALFLVGLAILYGILGTLSMADIALKVPRVPQSDRGLLHAGAAILAVAFFTKAAMWPLGSWLVPAYRTASAPVGAIFALMTKVGVYTLLRLSTLLFSSSAGPSAHLGGAVLLYGGLSTIGFGALGLMASLRLGRIAGFSILVSSGTLLAAIGVGEASVTSAALYYLLSATLAASALFLLVELVERAASGEESPLRYAQLELDEDTNLDDAEAALVGRDIPVSLALLGLAFMACVLIVSGLPPLSGFVAKLQLMMALFNPGGAQVAHEPTAVTWCFCGLLLLSGLSATVSLSRAGIQQVWSTADHPARRWKVVEVAPVLALISAAGWLTLSAEPVLHYTRAAAEALYDPRGYVEAVLSTKPVPGPASGAGEEEAP